MYDIYTIQEGDTIESIANRYNITSYILEQLNGFNLSDKFNAGSNIIVPKITSAYFDYYTIRKGDTLYKIAEKYGVDFRILALINGLEEEDYIYPNQVIAVPKNGIKYYVVSEWETLQDVASKLNTNINNIIIQNSGLFLASDQLVIYKPN